jgi:hypothetical protein
MNPPILFFGGGINDADCTERAPSSCTLHDSTKRLVSIGMAIFVFSKMLSAKGTNGAVVWFWRWGTKEELEKLSGKAGNQNLAPGWWFASFVSHPA